MDRLGPAPLDVIARGRPQPAQPLDKGTVVTVDRAAGRCTVDLDSGALGAGATCLTYVPAPRERVWLRHEPPCGLAVAGRMRGEPGLLGPGGINATPVALGTTAVAIAQAEAVVQSDRIVRVSCHVGAVVETSSIPQAIVGYVDDFASGVGAYVAQFDYRTVAAGMGAVLDGHIDIIGATPGYHLYRLMVYMSAGTGLAVDTAYGTSPGPSTIVVEDVGSAIA